MRFVSKIFSLTMICLAHTAAAAETCRNDPPPAGAEAPATRFMQQLQVGKGADAVGAVIDASKLWSQRPGAKEQMTGQVDAAARAYGPVRKFEKVCSENIGSLAVRQYYIAQHAEMVTRWEFDLVLGDRGWMIAYFGFDDQVKNWF